MIKYSKKVNCNNNLNPGGVFGRHLIQFIYLEFKVGCHLILVIGW
jgi:hypothetical protein